MLNPKAAEGHVVPAAEGVNDEALMLLTAGNDTTATAMILGLYELCSRPNVKTRIEKELLEAFPRSWTDIKLDKLRKLPCLVEPLLAFVSRI